MRTDDSYSYTLRRPPTRCRFRLISPRSPSISSPRSADKPARLLPNWLYVPLWTRKCAGGNPGWVLPPGFRLPSVPVNNDAVGPTPDRAERELPLEPARAVVEGSKDAARLNGSAIPDRPRSEPSAAASTPPAPPAAAPLSPPAFGPSLPFETDSEGDAAPFEPFA